jgi:tRNA A-37 threonylcarbamoyl transferase component Bud32
LAKDGKGDVVVVKRVASFQEHMGKPLPPSFLAEKELTALQSLHNAGITNVPELAYPDVIEVDGGFAVITKYKDGYTSFNGIKSLLLREVSGQIDSHILEDSYNSLANIHSVDRIHGDLHLDNIGVVPPTSPDKIADVFLIDFELSNDLSDPKYSNKYSAKIGDVMNFTAHLLYMFSNDTKSYEDVSEKLITVVSEKLKRGYFEYLNLTVPANLELELEVQYQIVSAQMRSIGR